MIACTSVTNACTDIKGDKDETMEALVILWSTFNHLYRHPEYGGPDHLTHITLLKALRDAMHMSDERDEITKRVFQRCVKDGEVSKKVLVILKSALPLRGFSSITGRGSLNHDSIPAAWKHIIERHHEI